MRALLLTGVSAGAILIGAVEASAADRISPIQYAPQAAGWSGFYVGVNLGWANVRGQINDVNNNFGAVAGFQDVDPGNAFLLGGKLGYNFRTGGGPLVLGIEADVSAIFGEDATCGGTCATFTGGGNAPGLGFNLRGVASLVGRVGWAPTNRSMFYGLFGIATGAVTTDAWNNTQYDGSQRLFTGWTAGLGMDVMMSNNISLGIEGRYYDLGSQTFINPSNYNIGYHPTAWTATVGAKHYF